MLVAIARAQLAKRPTEHDADPMSYEPRVQRTAAALTVSISTGVRGIGWDDHDRGRSSEDAATRRDVGLLLAKGVVLP